jgi:hypothetical protein
MFSTLPHNNFIPKKEFFKNNKQGCFDSISKVKYAKKDYGGTG